MNDAHTSLIEAAAADHGLSFEALGLLTYLVAFPPGHRLTIEGAMARGRISRPKAYRLVKELLDAGYLTRTTIRRRGKFQAGWYDAATRGKFTGDKRDLQQPLPAELRNFAVSDETVRRVAGAIWQTWQKHKRSDVTWEDAEKAAARPHQFPKLYEAHALALEEARAALMAALPDFLSAVKRSEVRGSSRDPS